MEPSDAPWLPIVAGRRRPVKRWRAQSVVNRNPSAVGETGSWRAAAYAAGFPPMMID
jgi:hypothetical protein